MEVRTNVGNCENKCENQHNCYWFDQCGNGSDCQGFEPLSEELGWGDDYIDGLIEQGRRGFEEEWVEYLGEWE